MPKFGTEEGVVVLVVCILSLCRIQKKSLVDENYLVVNFFEKFSRVIIVLLLVLVEVVYIFGKLWLTSCAFVNCFLAEFLFC